MIQRDKVLHFFFGLGAALAGGAFLMAYKVAWMPIWMTGLIIFAVLWERIQGHKPTEPESRRDISATWFGIMLGVAALAAVLWRFSP